MGAGFLFMVGESETETRRSRIGTQVSVGPNTKKHLAWNGLSQEAAKYVCLSEKHH